MRLLLIKQSKPVAVAVANSHKGTQSAAPLGREPRPFVSTGRGQENLLGQRHKPPPGL
jgi:hypothetical protein